MRDCSSFRSCPLLVCTLDYSSNNSSRTPRNICFCPLSGNRKWMWERDLEVCLGEQLESQQRGNGNCVRSKKSLCWSGKREWPLQSRAREADGAPAQIYSLKRPFSWSGGWGLSNRTHHSGRGTVLTTWNSTTTKHCFILSLKLDF